MLGVAIQYENTSLQRTLTRLKEADQTPALKAIGMLLVARSKENILGRTGPTGPWPKGFFDTLYASDRTWRDISRTIDYDVDASSKTLRFGASHIAAPVRQLGTVGAGGKLPDIKPVKKKALAIPISDAASRASYQGIPAREAFPGAFLLKPAKGASPLFVGVVARMKGERTDKKTGGKVGGRLEQLYLITTRAKIRPHRFLPVDAEGKIAPADLLYEAEELIIDTYVNPEK